MHSLKFLVIAMGLAATPALAQSDAAPAAAASASVAVKKGAMVFSTDGRRIGRVDHVRADTVGVIFDGRFVNIPVSTLTSADNGFKSSLTRAEIGKL